MPGLLDKIAKKLAAKSDEDVVAELEAAREELRGFRRTHQKFRDRSHAAVDGSIADWGVELDRFLTRFSDMQGAIAAASGLPGTRSIGDDLGGLYATQDPAFAKRWHAAVDRATGFSELTSEQFAAEEQKRLRAISELEVELDRRRVAAAKAAADRELAALEERVTA